MTKKKNKKNNSIIIIFILSVLVILGALLIFTNPSFWFEKSVHEDARKYMTKHCLVFYPNSKTGKSVAKQIASENDGVYDYSLVPYGDYYLVNYGSGYSYFVDKEYNDIVINDIRDDGKKIIADYLRYYVKKQLPETYYSSNFLEKSYIDNLSFEGVTYSIENESLKCRFPDYDVDVLVPLKYIQEELGMDFGYPSETYCKPTYIDSDHPVICLTFNNGPDFVYDYENSTSVSIVNTLYRYDATATFYVTSDSLEDIGEWTDFQVYKFFKESINNGNEYGSNTRTLAYDVTDYDSDSALNKAIHAPGEYFEQNFNYEMLTYRPPYGVFNDHVLEVQDMPAILWCIDSNDWLNDDAQMTYDRIMDIEIDDGDILLFDDTYDSTAEAIKKIVPELINRGYQLVTVSEMLKYEGIDISTLKYYYNLNPNPYYE